MVARGDVRRIRARKRRRRVVRGIVKTVFWALVLAGTFVLGLGYGKTLSSEDQTSSEHVTVTAPRDAVTVTVPTQTVTVPAPTKPKQGEATPTDEADR